MLTRFLQRFADTLLARENQRLRTSVEQARKERHRMARYYKLAIQQRDEARARLAERDVQQVESARETVP